MPSPDPRYISPEAAKLLADVHELLAYPADCDHDCDEEGCTIDRPKCRDRHLHAAMRKLRAVLEPVHEGFHPRRLSNATERIYADEWKRANVRSPGINSGFTLIEHILCPELEPGDVARQSFRGEPTPAMVSYRDARVAAAVVQWLGTNCGLAFMQGCERRIKDAAVIRSSWASVVNFNTEAPPATEERAEMIVGGLTFADDNHRAHIKRMIVAAIEEARTDERRAVKQSLAALLAVSPAPEKPCEHQWVTNLITMPEGYQKPINTRCRKCGVYQEHQTTTATFSPAPEEPK